MKIKRLEICGFKSFVDKTVVRFDHEVTCIVGPNGCGKSNVVDAIRWVMGEQSAKNLRGKAMEDVIFNGCDSRGPGQFAEVTLTFDNTDGLGPPEYCEFTEIAVTRRLDREGRSDYEINRTPARLMDVTNLFLGTGVGRRAYSIIEQGRIGFIVSSRPEERRHLIEEAAGITKFKARKKAAERKMEQTQQNLLRIGDIVTEIDKNLASLKRQAQKAERYKQYRAEIRDLELLVASHKWLELVANQKIVKSLLDEVSARADGARFALRLRETEIESDRLAVYEAESHVEVAQKKTYELENTVRELEARIENHRARLAELVERERRAEREIGELSQQRAQLKNEHVSLSEALELLEHAERDAEDLLAREHEELSRRAEEADSALIVVNETRARLAEADTRIARSEAVLSSFERRREDAARRLEKLTFEREDLEAKGQEMSQELEELRARIEGLRGGKEKTAQERAEIETTIATLRDEIRESDRALDKLRSEVAEKRSRLRSLEQIQQKFEGVGAGVRAVMTHMAGSVEARSESGILGLVADRIECPSDLTQALAGVLGAELQSVVVKNLSSGQAAIEKLAELGRGRAAFLPQEPRRVVAPKATLPNHPAIVGWLSDLVGCAAEDRGLFEHLLGGVLVVENIGAAIELHASGFDADTLVTRDGTVLERSGRLTGGAGEDVGAHMLEVKREIRELYGVVSKLDAELDAVVRRHSELRQSIAQKQAELEAARSAAHDAEIAIVKADKDQRRAEDEVARARQRSEHLANEIGELRYALEEASGEEAEAREEMDDARSLRAQAEEGLQTAAEIEQEKKRLVNEQSAIVTEVKVAAAQAKQKAEGDRSTVERLSRSIAELDLRETRLREEIREGALFQGDFAGQLFAAKETLAVAVEQAFLAEQELGAVRVVYDAAKEKIGAEESALREIRTKIDADTKASNEFTLREREIALALEHLLESMAERHRLDLRKVIGDFHLRDIPDASVKTRIDELIRLVERMGEINLTAIEEFDEQSKRFDYMSAQKKDLEDALDQLDKAIKQMNRESRRMFKETFDAVNERFKVVFPTMFGGGRAELHLTNPEDLLETGVEIACQPPGKRLGSIELMSGGEKALTAVSLIFAIFQCKPSPFCLLDEVDAPLDEANIGRYNNAIRQMTGHSQFILISHSKRTMEMADILYGVTMETPGISKLVSVELTKQAKRQAPSEELEAAVA